MLTDHRITVIDLLRINGPMMAADIAAIAGWKPANATRVLLRMEGRGLIDVTRDVRPFIYSLRPEGFSIRGSFPPK